jgi:hypothetical protein
MRFHPFHRFHARIGAALLSLAAVASAQVTFTVNGTINSTGSGFTSGDTISFTFILVQNPPQAFTGFVNPGSLYAWEDDNALTDTPLWTNVTGSVNSVAFGGAWARPSANNAAPYSNVYAAGTLNPTIGLSARSDSGESIGLTRDGDALTAIQIEGYYTGLNFDHSSGTLPAANSYFPAYAGTYGLSSSPGAFFELNDTTNINFTPTTLTISAVPEPSTYAMLLGIAALGVVWLGRRIACNRGDATGASRDCG